MCRVKSCKECHPDYKKDTAKYFLLTVEIRDGEHEYLSRAILKSKTKSYNDFQRGEVIDPIIDELFSTGDYRIIEFRGIQKLTKAETESITGLGIACIFEY